MFDKIEADAMELRANIVELATRMKEVVSGLKSENEKQGLVGSLEETEMQAVTAGVTEKFGSEKNNRFGNKDEVDKGVDEVNWEFCPECKNKYLDKHLSLTDIENEPEMIKDKSFDSLTEEEDEIWTSENRMAKEDPEAFVEKLKMTYKTETEKFHQKIESVLSQANELSCPNIHTSDSEISYATACSDYDSDSNLSDKAIDDMYVDSVQSFFPDNKLLDEMKQNFEGSCLHALGFLENSLSSIDSEIAENEEVSELEQLPDQVKVREEWNEDFKKKSLDVTVDNHCDFSDDELTGLSELTACCVDSGNDESNPENAAKETVAVGNDQLSCKNENNCERVRQHVLISLSDANIAHIQVPEAIAGSVTDSM